MKTLLTALIFLTFQHAVVAQYQGGRADGEDNSTIYGTRVSGVIVSDKVLYIGGPGDGFHYIQASSFMDGTPSEVLFSGGRGDGYEGVLEAELLLSGVNLKNLYGGGNGDGYDREKIESFLGGQATALLYSGGNGDGYDADKTESFLNGQATVLLYSGGDGDGYDGELVSELTLLEQLNVLFMGGDGDGYDRSTLEGFFIEVLPVKWLSFEAIKQGDDVLLLWSTASESNNDYFEVERSFDGLLFEPISQVDGAGTTTIQQDYQDLDENPKAGVNYYRIKQVDFDGQSTFTDIQSVEFETEVKIIVYPNPAETVLNVSFPETIAISKYTVFDMNGKVVKENHQSQMNNGEIQIEVSDIATGYYLLILENESGIVDQIKFIKM